MVSNSQGNYVAIDGLWKSTPETVLDPGTVILQPVIHITGDLHNDLLVQGCFLSDGEYLTYWILSGPEYGRVESLLILKDQQLLLEECYYGYNREQTPV